MPGILRQRGVGLKRHTWPRVEIELLETIPESPKTTAGARFVSESQHLEQKPQLEAVELLQQDRRHDQRKQNGMSFDGSQGQMLWYSQCLEESRLDRERLSGKIKELELVCRSQSNANGTLLEDVRAWQANYDTIEAELVEAAQEIEEAKAYVRAIETTNANLRYALSQAKEEVERQRRRRWSTRLARCVQSCLQIPGAIRDFVHPVNMNHQTERSSQPVTRAEFSTPFLNTTRSRSSLRRAGTCSRMSSRAEEG